ncbi:hypothetical protein Dgeo_2992 (plasmid) [Deinococcus geothermalis DSM 11300]|uniref:Uncharacterized protein n=1 Tax=Deinococcus geothermalis (strain DSM 11300 / CIP 105573 / AG-3a) TaxID=319795 RepID=A8ZRC5_DEIGD|nr:MULTISPECIES: hypothetical protein [Deinococcus]ABW35034.1 hypothetical protein Dgeo_2992 [Deinococcus geothermalis DSM 11300]TDE84814.1 hypothetical protein E0686_15015 [Deinococcus sp. S9]
MSTPTVPLKPTPEQQAEVRALLGGLAVTVTHQPFGLGGYRVRGWHGTPLAKVHVLIRTREDAARLAQELPAHLGMPPVWEAPFPGKHPVPWTAGYLAVPKACLPREGTFLPAKNVNLAALPCGYAPGTPEHAAFLAGARAYLRALWAALPTRQRPSLKAS